MGGFAHQDSWRQRVCSGRRVILILMGLLAVVTLSLVVLGFMWRNYSTTLRKMKEYVRNSNLTLAVELADLEQKETDDLKTLQKVGQMVENLTNEATEVKSQFFDQINKLEETLQKMNCDLDDIKHKRKGPMHGCCNIGWHLFQQSCYWLSSDENSWTEAKVDCEEKNAQLVVLAGASEKQFVVQLAKPYIVWIGLKHKNRVWTWVDGTPQITTPWLYWKPNGRMYSDVFCTRMEQDGLWNDRFCHVRLKWVCEKPALL